MRRPPPISEIVRFPVTGGTAALAIGISLASFAGFDVAALQYSVAVRQGELWRLVTTILPHVSVFHLAFNIYWLWVFGTLIEDTFGQVRTLLLFLVLAAAPIGLEYAILVGGVGLSGVGYGLFGMLWILSRRDARFHDAVDSNTVMLFVGWFLFCVVLTAADLLPVANIAHAAGAGLGMLIGLAIASRSPMKQMMAALSGLVAIACVAASLYARPWINLSRRASAEAYAGYQELMAERNEKALRWMLEATRIDPGNADYWNNLGVAYQRLDRVDEARHAFEESERLKGR